MRGLAAANTSATGDGDDDDDDDDDDDSNDDSNDSNDDSDDSGGGGTSRGQIFGSSSVPKGSSTCSGRSAFSADSPIETS